MIEVAGRGLVVLLGCEHAGGVNTVAHALALTHSSRLAAVVGGFHLGTPAAIPLIGPTVDALATYRPELVVARDCTGWRTYGRACHHHW